MNWAISEDWQDCRKGWLGCDSYSTAWVATIPDLSDPECPAWPQALAYLRKHQLEDGGWGEASIYYAHERTISTLAAIMALNLWQADPADQLRIEDGLAALRRYALDLPDEPYAPIGFELLVPHFRNLLAPEFEAALPLDAWTAIDEMGCQKLALIQSMQPIPGSPQAWWFSMEMLPGDLLAQLDDSLLDSNGSIVTSTAATAAYLAARRRFGSDSPRACAYLSGLMEMGNGGVPLCWPTEVFEQTWTLDHFRRIGHDPGCPTLTPTLESVRALWESSTDGISHSEIFPIKDGDHTAVAFAVLNWAGLAPSEEPLLAFWNHDHLLTYPDERDASISANIHGLSALRSQPGFPHRQQAERLTDWLTGQMTPDGLFDDKWHLSPYYPVSRAIPAFAGWDDTIALDLVARLVEQQRPDGGWGWFGESTVEETAYCVIALYSAYRGGLLESPASLTKAAAFIGGQANGRPVERLWIGKALYRPEGLLKATLFAAQTALRQLDLLPA